MQSSVTIQIKKLSLQLEGVFSWLTSESGVLNSLSLQMITSLTFSIAGSQDKKHELPCGKIKGE